MSSASDHAELSTVRAQLDELTARVVQVADHYRDTADSAMSADLDAVERQLNAATRVLDRTISSLATT